MSYLVQGSDEWLEFRRSRVGSSESAALMGVCPYQTAFELYERKKGIGKDVFVHKAMKEGTRKEPLARDWYNAKTGEFYAPIVKVHPLYGRIHASIDGMTFDGEQAIEIKSPTFEVFHEIVKCGIPDNYFCQCQHIMFVAELEEMVFLVWLDENTYHIQFVQRDEKYILKMLDKITEFLKCLDTDTPPKKTKRKTKATYVEVEDKNADALARTIREASERIALDEKIKSDARSELLRIADGRNIRGDGFSVLYKTMPGAIDYSEVPELKGINLEMYRKPAYKVPTIRCE